MSGNQGMNLRASLANLRVLSACRAILYELHNVSQCADHKTMPASTVEIGISPIPKEKNGTCAVSIAVCGSVHVPPGLIGPLDGTRSTTTVYRVLYTIAKPLLPLLRLTSPHLHVLTTRQIARALLTGA